MLKLNYLKVEIETGKKQFIFAGEFKNGLNLIYSEGNTVGKSSVIASIYYALGLEEIIGGKGPHVLSSAFKSQIEYNNEEELPVLESKIFLEISNGNKNITVHRSAKSSSRDPNLITVFFSELNKIDDVSTSKEDMYVHLHNAAKNQKGFHTFLESFLNLNLPFVPNKTERESKLYMQLVFSAMFIEQKRGWADIFSGMPYYDILEQKKRVIEYILGLDTLKNEKLKHSLKVEEKSLKEKWKDLYQEHTLTLSPYKIQLSGISKDIQIIKKGTIKLIYDDSESKYEVHDYLKKLKTELSILAEHQTNKKENTESLLEEIEATKTSIRDLEKKLKETSDFLEKEMSSLDHLQSSLEMIDTDIINNKDALKLQKLGSKEKFNTFDNICPTCEQSIQDTILTIQMTNKVMSIDENIKHLESQKQVFEYAIKQKEKTIEKIKANQDIYKSAIKKLYFILQITNNDLYSPAESHSEKSVYRKVELQKLIYDINDVMSSIEDINDSFANLSKDWALNQEAISKLPSNNFTGQDIKKLDKLREYFINNLELFGYKSSLDIRKVEISKNTYMPMIENFDMKFDSSASDHIRRIWAFTLALLQTSIEFNGNHPRILIFDEPGQHSVIVKDMEKFLNELSKIKEVQIIVGITIKETEIKKVVLQNIADGAHGIQLINRAFN